MPFKALATDLPETERQKTPGSLYHIHYSIKANRFCEFRRPKIQTYEPCSSQKRFAFIEYGTKILEFSVFLLLADL